MFKVKIVVFGPSKSGKTVLSNYLADATDLSGREYRATQGVRILEFESGELAVAGRSTKADVELWDCSGDKKCTGFESCWPAIMRDANGVVYIYNPDQLSHAAAIDFWHAVASDVPDHNCLMLCYEKPNASSVSPLKLGQNFPNVMTGEVDMDQNPEEIHEIFKVYLEHLLGNLAEGRDRDELNIMSEIRAPS